MTSVKSFPSNVEVRHTQTFEATPVGDVLRGWRLAALMLGVARGDRLAQVDHREQLAARFERRQNAHQRT